MTVIRIGKEKRPAISRVPKQTGVPGTMLPSPNSILLRPSGRPIPNPSQVTYGHYKAISVASINQSQGFIPIAPNIYADRQVGIISTDYFLQLSHFSRAGWPIRKMPKFPLPKASIPFRNTSLSSLPKIASPSGAMAANSPVCSFSNGLPYYI